MRVALLLCCQLAATAIAPARIADSGALTVSLSSGIAAFAIHTGLAPLAVIAVTLLAAFASGVSSGLVIPEAALDAASVASAAALLSAGLRVSAARVGQPTLTTFTARWLLAGTAIAFLIAAIAEPARRNLGVPSDAGTYTRLFAAARFETWGICCVLLPMFAWHHSRASSLWLWPLVGTALALGGGRLQALAPDSLSFEINAWLSLAAACATLLVHVGFLDRSTRVDPRIVELLDAFRVPAPNHSEGRLQEIVMRIATSETIIDGTRLEVAESIVRAVHEAVPVSGASVWVPNSDGEEFRCIAALPRFQETPHLWPAAALREALRRSRVIALNSSPTNVELTGPSIGEEACSVLLAGAGTGGRSIAVLRIHRPAGARWSGVEQKLARDLVAFQGQVYLRDENKRLEGMLRHRQKMESIGHLAGSIAHDFNNILTSILGYSELVANALTPDSPLREDVEEIRRSGRRAESLTRQLLTFSRRQNLEPVVIDLNSVLAGMENMLRLVIHDGIALEFELEADLCTVQADVTMLEQVVLNLAINARDAMPDGGVLKIRTRSEHRDGGTDPNESVVALSVSDTGHGMTSEVQERMFEPFFTTKEKGTGLGLSTAYGLIRQSGGWIDVDSNPGRGTAITVRLPLVETASEIELTPVARPRGRGHDLPRRILLVEDEEGIRALAARALREAGCDVREASSAERALAGDTDVDLLITDVVMPGMSGGELVAYLRRGAPHLPVLVMSGHYDDVIARHGVESSEWPFLSKPFTPAQLIAAVRAAHRPRGTYADPPATV